jgi:carboxymethylenebutenolidase
MRTAMIAGLAGLLLMASPMLSAADAQPASPYPTKREMLSYAAGNAEVPVLLVSPADRGAFPVVLYVHGRWGITEEIARHLDAIAERGVVVLAPDYYFSRAIPELPPFSENDAIKDIEPAFAFADAVRARYTNTTGKIAIIGQDHGGYFALLLAAAKPDRIGAFIGVYPLLGDPTASKTQHLYAYSPAVEDMKTPTLLAIGKDDWEMRRIQNGRVLNRLEGLKTDVRLIEYAGAQRCFDWRTNSGVIADRIARQDLLNQIVGTLKANLGGEKLLVLGPHGWEHR